MRILGLDVGSKTIGVAVSDEMGWTAQGVTTLQRRDIGSTCDSLLALVTEYGVDTLVVGLPLHMSGEEGVQAKAVRDFIGVFQRRASLSIPIVYCDERMSTMAAERGLLEADLSREKRRKVINKMAAVFILQGYLDQSKGEP